jgi:hypothetical protein
VVKDAIGNVYKLKFLNFTSADGGERGYPNIEYKLVKKHSSLKKKRQKCKRTFA